MLQDKFLPGSGAVPFAARLLRFLSGTEEWVAITAVITVISMLTVTAPLADAQSKKTNGASREVPTLRLG